MKPVKGWEELYKITEDGKVFSIRRNIFLKPRESMDGYMRVCLCNDKLRREYRIARLVAEAFIENIENKPEVNHKDYNRKNDSVDNLEWITGKENSYYSFKEDRYLIPETYKVYTFTNVYNGKAFSIIGINNVAKQFHCTAKNFKAIICKYANTGMYVKQGIFKGLRVDSEYLKVQRLSQSGVGLSDPKCKASLQDEDIV
ncbi:MAG: hypothetical protein EOM41_10395 [Bacilli bacterium]|nr:hypothetical protein [Bacilli bacterium]